MKLILSLMLALAAGAAVAAGSSGAQDEPPLVFDSIEAAGNVAGRMVSAAFEKFGGEAPSQIFVCDGSQGRLVVKASGHGTQAFVTIQQTEGKFAVQRGATPMATGTKCVSFNPNATLDGQS